MISDDDVRYWENERKKIQSDPDYLEENYEDVTDEFLPARVDALQGDVRLNNLTPTEFKTRYEELSDEEQRIFLEFIARQTKQPA